MTRSCFPITMRKILNPFFLLVHVFDYGIVFFGRCFHSFLVSTNEHKGLWIVVFFTVGIRLPGVCHGLPVYVLPSECEIITQAANVFKGKLFPEWTFYGGLTFYVHTLCIGFVHLIHYAAVKAAMMQDTHVPFWIFYVTGRCLNILFCCILICATYGIALRTGNKSAGIIAALVVSFFPLPHRFSLQITPDMLVTMCAAVSIYYSVCYSSNSNKKGNQPLYLAALFSGLAIGSKYMFLAVVPFAVAKFIVCRKSNTRFFDSTLFKACFIVIGAFLLTSPYVIITFSDFLSGGLQRVHTVYSSEPFHKGLAYCTPVLFIKELFLHDMTPGLFVISIFGMIYLAVKRSGPFFVISLGPLLWFTVMSFYKIDFTYNIMILLVPLAVSTGIIISKINRNTLRYLLVIALCLQPLINDLHYIRTLRKKDIRYVVLQWIDNNLPAHSSVAWEDYRPFFQEDKFKCFFIGFSSLAHLSPKFLRNAGYNYVISPFYEPLLKKSFKYESEIKHYQMLLQTFPVVKEFMPGDSCAGNIIRIVKIQ